MNITASQPELRSARWAAGLFLLVVVLQRFAVPGLPLVPLLLPAVLLWVVAAAVKQVVEIDRNRLAWWLAMGAATAIVMPLQSAFVTDAEVSVTGWGLIMAVWLPFTVRFRSRGTQGYLAALARIAHISSWLAVVAVVMTVSQLLGLPYTDIFAKVIPEPFQLMGYVITYPISYGSTLYKSNAWFGLEPSAVSVLLGIGLLAAIFARVKWWNILLTVLGLVATVSGSGIVIALIGLGVMTLHRSRKLLLRYLPLVLVVLMGALFTPFGRIMLSRATEFQADNSSTALRAIDPYAVLYPRWIDSFQGVLLGYGPGSAQRVITRTNVLGLSIPSPAKVFFEYGMLAGLVLAAFMFICYWGSPSRALAVSLLMSYWLFIPGVTTVMVLAPLLATVSLWSPRVGPLVEVVRPDRRRQPDAESPPAPAMAHLR